jgi:hypothetical protein
VGLRKAWKRIERLVTGEQRISLRNKWRADTYFVFMTSALFVWNSYAPLIFIAETGSRCAGA